MKAEEFRKITDQIKSQYSVTFKEIAEAIGLKGGAKAIDNMRSGRIKNLNQDVVGKILDKYQLDKTNVDQPDEAEDDQYKKWGDILERVTRMMDHALAKNTLLEKENERLRNEIKNLKSKA